MSVSNLYPGGDDPVTANLGLFLFGMDYVVAENFITLDAAIGSGSSVKINGTVIPSVNFVNSATVTFSVVGSNVSATATSGVTSVFSRTGAVVANANDYAAVASLVLGDGLGDDLAFGPAVNHIILGTNNAGYLQFLPTSFSLNDGNNTTISSTSGVVTLDSSGGTGQFQGNWNFANNTTFSSTVTDGSSSVGTSGQVLSSTVTGVKWVTASSGTVTSVTGTANQIVATGTANVVLSIANPFTFPGPASMGSNYISETRVVSAGGTTTAGLLVKTQPTGNVQTAALGDVGTTGIAITSQTAGQNVEMARIGLVTAVADNTITIGDIMVVGTVTAGRVSDSGQTSSLGVSNQLQIVGKALTAAVAGGTFTMQVYGPGFYGDLIPSGQVLWNQIGNAAANLTLFNDGYTTTFQQSSAIAWLWANTTVASAITTNASPLLELAANYWTGAASAQDLWSIESALAAGTNGASSLIIAHTGSTGNAQVLFPVVGANTYPSLSFVGQLGSGLGEGSASGRLGLFSGGRFDFYGVSTNYTSLICVAGQSNLGTNVVNNSLTLSGRTTTSTTAGSGSPCVGLGNIASNFSATSGTQIGVGIGSSLGSGCILDYAPTATSSASFIACQIETQIASTAGTPGTFGYTGLQITAVETQLGTGVNRLIDCYAGSTGVTSVWALNNKGVVAEYNGVATVRGGQATIVASSLLTAQSAAITATTIYAIPAAKGGMYKITWVATVTTAGSTSSALGGTTGLQIIFTNGNGDGVVKTSTPTTATVSATNTTADTISGTVVGYCAASTNLQYAFGYSSVGVTPMVYDLALYVEALY